MIPLCKVTWSQHDKPEKKKQFHDWSLYNLKLTFFAHILQDISQIILVCRNSKHFISGKEGDLRVGFLDRFNSSYFYFSFFTTGIGSAISPLFFNRFLSNLVGKQIMTREGAIYIFMSEGQRSRSPGVKTYLTTMILFMGKER